MSSIKPIKLYSHASGPNPWKVAMVLEELAVPYTNEFLDFGSVKQEPFISVNPNGRVPAIEDPNTGVSLWESGAIINYLIAEYDKDHKFSYGTSPQKYETDQWLFFQVSGQGPYYGQAVWFTRYHPEDIPSARDRYRKEIERVVSVIDSHLSKTKQDWLVGDKCTYADYSFVPWGTIVDALQVPVFEGGKNQTYKAWWERVMARPAVVKTMQERKKAMESH